MKKVLFFFMALGFFSSAFANDFQTPKLDLKVRKITQCPTVSGWRFEVTNNDSKPINTSYLEIRFWVYEPNKKLIGKFFNGVEWTDAYGIKNGQAVMCAFLSPTYDTIGNRKADYAIRYRNGEDHWLKPGETWKDIRFGYGGYNLEENTDYSQIPQEQKGRASESIFFDTLYDDPHFCLYYEGHLVQEWLSTAKADPKTGVEPDPYRTVGQAVANISQESASNDSINPMYSKLPELTQPLTTQDLNKVIMQNGQMINVAQAKMEIQAYSQAHPGQTVFARPMQGNPNIRYASLPSQPSNGVAFSYDADGNTLTDPSGRVFTYDSLDRMVHVTGPSLDVSYVYDGDGLRVKKINNITGIQTSYLWDTNNITGVPQVVEELQGGQVVCIYTYGSDGLISMDQLVSGSWVLHYFGKDGEGSVRNLEDQNGQVTDTFDYDAFGNLINQTGSTQNNMLYAGEYFDSDVQLYYLRNRWMSPSIGRFYSMDNYEGDQEDPLSLHKYVYASNNPANRVDPSGNDDVEDVGAEEPDVLWPGTVAKPNSVRAFITFSGFNPANPSSMQALANLAKGNSSLGLDGNASSFTYQNVTSAVAYVTGLSARNPGKKVEIVSAGHSLGGSAVDLFASKINGMNNVELDGMYYFDAVGYAPSSDPGTNKRTYLLNIAGAPFVNPEEISPNVKNFGMFYQRSSSWTGFTAWGINRYFASGATNIQFDMEVLGVNHSTIASNGNVQNAVINAARSDY